MASADDTTYKQLFSHPEMVRDLLLGFVPEPWISQLNLNSFERVSGSYVGDDGDHRHSDMVWKVQLGEHWVYLYLLLEFQSRSDPWMALRMQVYVGLLYQDLVRRHELPQPGMLPPVFPLVLYGGVGAWSASKSLADLMAPMPDSLLALQPAQRYLLIDQGAIAPQKLTQFNNLVAAYFRLAAASTEAEATTATDGLDTLMTAGTPLPLLRTLLCLAARRLRCLAKAPKIGGENGQMEIAAMTTTQPMSFKEGVAFELKLYGQKDKLKSLLSKRFGALSANLDARIEDAEVNDIDLWYDRLFDAKEIEEVFAESK
ncbi:MAG: Rpn family recombination-promoting nuclease/putative transposase [Pseudomonadota bacterium]